MGGGSLQGVLSASGWARAAAGQGTRLSPAAQRQAGKPARGLKPRACGCAAAASLAPAAAPTDAAACSVAVMLQPPCAHAKLKGPCSNMNPSKDEQPCGRRYGRTRGTLSRATRGARSSRRARPGRAAPPAAPAPAVRPPQQCNPQPRASTLQRSAPGRRSSRARRGRPGGRPQM